METAVLNIQGEKVGKCELPEKVFGVTPDKHLLHEAAKVFLANQRIGCACAKTRAEVSGGGKKPWKQKGTGRARSGSNRSPLWTGGGVVFGPRPHSFRRELPQFKRRMALAHALSAKLADGAVVVVDKFDLPEAKTRHMSDALAALDAGRKPMIISTGENGKLLLAGRNVPGLVHCRPENLNTYGVLNSTKLVITRTALDALNVLWTKGE
ncbi:MAG: 50S ribosomal protein L4 [Elusimicrobiaceae bacterium]|nr:50S ribosomal protein L4 [Elusimicrobiaceae bacterium]